jgi:iron complex outermembrane recepter protein
MSHERLNAKLCASTALVVALLASAAASQARADTNASASGAANSAAAASGNHAAGTPQETQVADANAGVQQIEQVVVTARRVSERLQDVPISITVFNQQQLRNHDVFNASQLANYTPSLSANTQFGPDNSSFSIRGFTQEIRTAASVGVFFADVVEPRGGGVATTAGDGAGPGDYFDLQNVQVLKGPQGTLFGRNTTGGDILLVPNKPTDNFGGYLEASAGNYGMQEMQGVVNLPVNDNVRLRLGADEQTRDGYEPNISGIGPSSFGNVDYYALRASLDIDVTPQLENYTIASFSRSENHGVLSQIFACNPTSQLANTLLDACAEARKIQGGYYWDVDNDFPNPESEIQQWRVINTTTWTVLDNLTIKNIASYSQFNSILRESIMGENFHFLGGSTPIIFTDSNPLPGNFSNDQYTTTEELQFQGNFLDNRFTWQGGGYLEVSGPLALLRGDAANFAECTNLNVVPPQCINLLGNLTSGADNGGSQYSTGEISYHNMAGYWQGTYALLDELKLTGGIRYTSDLTRGAASQIVYTPPPPPPAKASFPFESCANTSTSLSDNCLYSGRQHSHAPTWVLDLDYTPIENTMFYAKYSRGYRQGGVDPFGPAGFNIFAPERVDAYEVGAKTTFEGWVPGSLDVAAFYNDFQHQQLLLGFENPAEAALAHPQQGVAPPPLNFAPSPTSSIVNAGRSRIQGFEADTSLFPFGENFRLDLNGTYLDTKLISEDLPSNAEVIALTGGEFANAVATTAVGGPLPLSPTWKTSVSGTYTLPVPDALGKISAGTTLVYTDKERTADPTSTPFYDIKSSSLLNLFVNWDQIYGYPVSAAFFMTNALDYKYETYIPGLFSGYGFESRSIGEPRMWGFRVRYDFGE